MVEPAARRRKGTVETEAIRVSVRDNGAGLPADHKQGFGMLGMRERVLALGGTMTVASTNQGVTVKATVPCGISPSQLFQPAESARIGTFSRSPDLNFPIPSVRPS